MKKIIFISIISLLFLSCEKELNINDFSDDFSFYETELRIEGVIYPSENTAIVRIDQSVKIDEANLYDCLDNDLDWNYYNCSENSISYESWKECNENCYSGGSCNQHLYACKNFDSEENTDTLLTFLDEFTCKSQCQWDCITDDTGTDGFLTPDNNQGPGWIQPDQDGSENNGIPDCNEPNIDEYNEILPDIHVDSCEVKIYNSDLECNMIYNENAGSFFETSRRNDSFELINYGGFIPDTSCSGFNFQNYNTSYHLSINCENTEYSRYGTITSTDIIKRPPVVFKPNQWDKMISCSDSLEVYECLTNNELSLNDTLRFLTDYFPDVINSETNDTLSHDDFIIILNNLNIDTSLIFIADETQRITFSSLFETNKFQAVQYYYDQETNQYIYYHGHPLIISDNDGISDDNGQYFDNTICLTGEIIVAEKLNNEYRFKYNFYNFSPEFEDYYFFDQLDLSDPVRSNIRDGNGNPVMGGFGSMASGTVYFEIWTPNEFLDEFYFPNIN